MSFLFPVLLFLIFAACVAFIFSEGMWGAALRLINVVVAALLATNFWEPVARLLEGMVGTSFTYWLDFVCLWGLFAVTLLILRILTRRVSQVKVRFLSLADRIGGGIFAALVGMAMVAFTTFTLHTAPLGEEFMFGGFNPDSSMNKHWAGFVWAASKGSLSHLEDNVFPTEFIETYKARRAAFEELAKSNSLRAGSGVPARKGGSGASAPEPDGEETPEEGSEAAGEEEV